MSFSPHVQVGDVALRQGDDANAGEGQALEQSCNVLLVAAQPVHGLGQYDVEAPASGVLDQLLDGRPKERGAGDRPVAVAVRHRPALPLGLVEFAERVAHLAAVELGGELALLQVDAAHDTEVAVVDLALVVVLHLHDLVARRIGPAEALHPDLARRVQRPLQLHVQGPSAQSAPVHGAQHLNVAHGVEAEAGGDAFAHQPDQGLNRRLRLLGLDEVEVGGRLAPELRHQALVNAVRVGHHPAARRLAEHLGQPHHGHGVGRDQVGQHLAGADRGELVHVADQQQGGAFQARTKAATRP